LGRGSRLPYEREEFQVNDKIRFRSLRVIDKGGEHLGIIPTQDALSRAKVQELDLVVINPVAQPPVALIGTWSSIRYNQQQKEKQSRRNNKAPDPKQIQVALQCCEGDLNHKMVRAREFLTNGTPVMIEVTIRGRQSHMRDKAQELMTVLIQSLNDVGKVFSTQGNVGGRSS